MSSQAHIGSTPKIYLGVDHGAKGAIAAIHEDGKIHSVLPMPLKGDGTIDCFQLYSWLFENYGDYDYDIVVCGERLHAIFRAAAASTFQFGKNIGLVTGIIECLDMEYYEVPPRDWQRFMFTHTGTAEKLIKKKGRKKLSRDTKGMALVAALSLWPGAAVHAHHDGIIDALLIARYASLTYRLNRP